MFNVSRNQSKLLFAVDFIRTFLFYWSKIQMQYFDSRENLREPTATVEIAKWTFSTLHCYKYIIFSFSLTTQPYLLNWESFLMYCSNFEPLWIYDKCFQLVYCLNVLKIQNEQISLSNTIARQVSRKSARHFCNPYMPNCQKIPPFDVKFLRDVLRR